MHVVDRVDLAAWHQFLGRARGVSPFHAPAMVEIQRRARGQRATVLAAMQEGQILALAVAVDIQFGGRVGRWLTARQVMHGIAHLDDSLEAVAAVLAAARRRAGAAVLTEIRHHAAVDSDVAAVLAREGFRHRPHLEIEIDLGGGPDEVLSRVGTRTRRRIRRGLRQGWVAVEAVETAAAFEEWLALLTRTYRRIGLPLAHRSLFEAAFAAGEAAGCWLLLARVDGRPAASSLELAHGDTVYGWYNGVDRRFSARVPNELLTWHVLRTAAERGFRLYAFGGAGEPGVPYGVRDFKAKFGGVERDLGRDVLVHAPLRSRVLDAVARAAKLWGRA